MRYSKNIYLDDDNEIDADIRSLPQVDLRNRLRTGHIIHEILNDLASSLQDFIHIEDEHRLEALLDTLQHHERMQKRMKKPGGSEVVIDKPVVADDRASTPADEPVPRDEPEPVQEIEEKVIKKIPCKFKSIPGM